MNILVTTVCNRRCPYCFASDQIGTGLGSQPGESRFITHDNFAKALAFAARTERVIGILGGEPSLHPDFPALIEQTWAAGLDAKIFTNGCWSEDALEAVACLTGRTSRNLRLVVNTNHPDITPEKERVAQRRLFAKLPEHCSLSFNIHSLDYDAGFLVDFIVKYRLMRDIRLGLASPLVEGPSAFIAAEDFPQVAPLIMALSERCDAEDIHLGFDCGFTLCMFSAEQLGLLKLRGADIKCYCEPALDINVDLSSWACFPLASLGKADSIDEFCDAHEMQRHFKDRFFALYSSGSLPECVGCKQLKRKRCAGGCGAHVYRRYA